ncbi:MAG: DNA translocase FtsK 4TM domain-containing protein [Lachnospiraceae bacterium]
MSVNQKKNTGRKLSAGKKKEKITDKFSKERLMANNPFKLKRNPKGKNAGTVQQLSLEVRIFSALGAAIILMMCNFHLCLGIGEVLYAFMHGMFGCMAYILPILLFIGYVFLLSNPGSSAAVQRVRLGASIYVLTCCLIHLLTISETQPFSLVYYFTISQKGVYGGVAGGLIAGGMQHIAGTVAAMVVVILMLVITGILITGRSVLLTVKNQTENAKELLENGYGQARDRIQNLFSREETEDGSEDWSEEDESGYENEDWNTEPQNRNETNRYENKGLRLNLDRKDRRGDFLKQTLPFLDGVGKSDREKKKEQSTSESGEGKKRTVGSNSDWKEIFRRKNGSAPGSAKESAEGMSDAADRNWSDQSGHAVVHTSQSLKEMGFDVNLFTPEKNRQKENAMESFIAFDGIRLFSDSSFRDRYSAADSLAEIVFPEDDFPETNRKGYSDSDYDEFDFSETSDPSEFNPESEDSFPAELPADSQAAEEPEDWTVYEDEKETAVDLTEHVVLPEDGPITEAMKTGTEQKKQAPVLHTAPSESIWKKETSEGSRSTSGAVSFTPVPNGPKPKTKAPVVYKKPPTSLLRSNKAFSGSVGSAQEMTRKKLGDTLESFGVKVKMTGISVGPSVTRYELEPEPGVKVSRIVALQDDIKLALAASDIRIEAPIPGKSAIGIEVPNQDNSIVGFRELVESGDFNRARSRLTVAVGRDISGKIVLADLAKMPHLLIAGATGSGKSVCINTLVMSIIYKADPSEVKLIMVDPKVVELSVYNGIPHLLVPVVTDARKAANALRWAVDEMNSRYKKFAEYNVRNLEGFNEKLKEEKRRNPQLDEPLMYQMVIIVDELADLMMVSPGEVEEAICRLAQMARAAGIHLVLATQRPSVNVITGLIKANVPSRIAFAVSSGVDSRTIIDMNGAEKLLGKGDMLFYPYGLAKPVRVQGAFISDAEVSDVVEYLYKNNGEISGREQMEQMITSVQESNNLRTERDEYFESAARFIIEKDKASIGALQRNFKIGFNRAARIMDQLADAGVVGEEDGTKPRKILMSMEEFNELIMGN